MKKWNSPTAILIALSFIMLTVLDFYLGLSASKIYQIYDSVPDEVLFYFHAKSLADNISGQGFSSALTFGTPYGYGFPFWLLLAATYKTLKIFELENIAAIKSIFLTMKWISLSICTEAIYRKKKLAGAIIFLALFFSCSAYFFYGKILSPEFLTLFLASIALCLILKEGANVGWKSYMAIFISTTAVAVKPTAAPVLLAVSMHCLLRISSSDKKLPSLALMAVFAATAIGMASIPILTSKGMAVFTLWNSITGTRTIESANFYSWILERSVIWDLIPLSGAVGYIGCIVALIIGSTLIAANARKMSPSGVTGMIFFFSGSISFVATTFVSGYLDWYLWIPALLCIFGVPLMIPDSISTSKALTLGLALTMVSAPETYRRTTIRLNSIEALNRQERLSSKINEFLNAESAECRKPVIIVTDMLSGISQNRQSTISVIRMRDLVSLNILQDDKNNPLVSYFLVPPSMLAPGGSESAADISSATHIAVNTRLGKYSHISDMGKVSVMGSEGTALFKGKKFSLSNRIGDFDYYRATDFCDNPTAELASPVP